MANNSPRLPKRKTILATAAIAVVAAAVMSLSSPASLRIDGQRMISDVPPVTTPKGEAFVPLRVVAETLGAEANYDAKTGLIELTRGNDTMHMRVGDKVATLNGNRMTLKHAPFSVRGRTMVSLNTIARAFGTTVHYDGAHAKIDVMSPGLIEAGAQQDSP
ncbi:MAG TPA: copper amine oxidase N-terminal domain-containing protein [Candidatus Baltobacteraceae bacterium]|nr:copper amine oxidase N-terminal domain-containing protein [Candidatus Baltobacteraceae bacterium]